MAQQTYLSQEGLERLRQESKELKTIKRQEIAKRLQDAKELGDLSENAEYIEAKEAQSMNEVRIAELEEIIKNAVVIETPQKKDTVEIGSTIEVKSADNGIERFVIVGSEEARPAEGKISNESPLGRSFLGKKMGDEVEIKTPKGIAKYKIIKIE
ncbi:transcription elongation factor GreA [Candidatus Azambacteria bacterium RIFCSPHIGHO2_01_FULL_44_55]|uniref:Transcription elongation factor GreA n=1 Tax=Candidatus Azambacteria bacterium RIFCSPLOWO2_02_FULL_44_14 TaxID=1797306 RepID=A0A1F5CBM6_9BACT|nr:MAG: transcription elongation factor GreA [Candidatus Azambacteria bacterium RIFCSPLOWO2_01_FULL_44_84]OGD33207.1 MAG: transcription elongation factor GreA [Candidatus Azambacteria bacterium RIFCSPHIGHO2_02_FULL_45_18]OGD40312.1 MAG: transcription elongation factor GreA [Candidatus Azambacteria bacterium RIFCSPLOWO2_02_FULL_44_14]OGD40738.1 MAG: transcription elongation factor GreA [Candidatus Azambacteria bacterium RIFCSPHIGHO2_01_FULL_44_55]OGD50401.1 MAG: transcription elongation factor G